MTEEKQLIKSSIFRQKTYAKRYELIATSRDVYSQYRGYQHSVYRSLKEDLISDDEIFSCDIEMPLLEIGESFYIEEKNMLVTVIERYRTSKSKIVYYINDKHVDDAGTKDSYIQIQKELTKYNELIDAYKSALNLLSKHQKKKFGKEHNLDNDYDVDF